MTEIGQPLHSDDSSGSVNICKKAMYLFHYYIKNHRSTFCLNVWRSILMYSVGSVVFNWLLKTLNLHPRLVGASRSLLCRRFQAKIWCLKQTQNSIIVYICITKKNGLIHVYFLYTVFCATYRALISKVTLSNSILCDTVNVNQPFLTHKPICIFCIFS